MYFITGVRYIIQNSKKYIQSVRIEGLNNLMSKDFVINMLVNDHQDFYTMVNEKKSAKVNYFTLDGENFLRTDANKIKLDNLGELPEV